ncbi:MAG: DUF4256 domain-containing protein [Pseudobacter sp.]|uniref:DUF4256 domain-containing protein n=1 Tax=Pseudobacter sp. TaxID=2045420 RepID=UPI003F82298E
MSKKKLSTEEKSTLLNTLQTRFEKNKKRHSSLKWEDVAEKLEARPDKLRTLLDMEETGGEPDVTGFDKKTGEYIFTDCAPESPKGRRSVCYDGEALAARKQHKPDDSAIEMAKAIGIEILDEEEYRHLQTLGEFDLKTSSWIKTPPAIRRLGGALFGDRRYDHVFFYHNGADSYYGARGFRGSLKV